jgi:hypothetical protein
MSHPEREGLRLQVSGFSRKDLMPEGLPTSGSLFPEAALNQVDGVPPEDPDGEKLSLLGSARVSFGGPGRYLGPRTESQLAQYPANVVAGRAFGDA